MRKTVPRPVPKRSGKEKETLDKDVLPTLEKARGVLNITEKQHSELTTEGTATSTKIWESDDLPQDCATRIVAKITGVGASGGYALYDAHGLFQSAAGVVTQIGSTILATTPAESDVAFSFEFAIVGSRIELRVTDNGVETFWGADTEVHEAKR